MHKQIELIDRDGYKISLSSLRGVADPVAISILYGIASLRSQ